MNAVVKVGLVGVAGYLAWQLFGSTAAAAAGAPASSSGAAPPPTAVDLLQYRAGMLRRAIADFGGTNPLATCDVWGYYYAIEARHPAPAPEGFNCFRESRGDLLTVDEYLDRMAAAHLTL